MIRLDDFLGTYTVTQGTYFDDSSGIPQRVLVNIGAAVTIARGRSTPCDPEPGTHQVCISIEGQPSRIFTFEPDDLCLRSIATLQYRGHDVPAVYQISLYRDQVGTGYKSVYGIVTLGDPEQVGVWGAQGNG